jgi:hypothetical protein
MKLSDMTIDEAIAYAVREVPEIVPEDWAIRSVLLNIPPSMRQAIWFHAAWVWLARQGRPDFIEAQADKFSLWDDFNSDYRDFPTEYHALAAACLLAAGKGVP